MNSFKRNRLLDHYFFLSYLIVLGIGTSYLKHLSFHGFRTSFYVMAVYLSYGFLYLLPAFLLAKAAHWIQARLKNDAGGNWSAWLVYAVAGLGVGITELGLLIDCSVYNIYHFHLNGFVWNLITAPGGIESMGGSGSTDSVVVLVVAGAFLLQPLLLWGLAVLLKCRLAAPPVPPRRVYRYLLIVILVLGIGERITYGISQLQGYGPVLTASHVFPFYMPMTFYHLAKRLGFNVHREKNIHVTNIDKLRYPLEPLQFKKQKKLPNIVLLACESWRWDMLDPEIMPAAWKFAQKAHRFTHNYSSGNGTRMGIFGLFYGLYAPYWFPFLNARQSPVLMDAVQKLGYQISMYTSARFTYPEFNKTVLTNLPGSAIHECSKGGPGWARDRKNVGDLIDFIARRDPDRPFFTFMFFESPHARYYFPPESVIRKDYLKDFNYATMSLEKDIGRIKNRYINSCHHLDSQLQRIIEYLEKNKLLDNTIVVMLGDHGEEFMEKGFWGHNSEFHDEQTRTPLILWIPGTGSSVSDRLTSHLDVAPTLLAALGVTNSASDYCLGHNLLGDCKRSYTVIGDWSRIAYVTMTYKIILPFKRAGFIQIQVTTGDDREIEDARSFLAKHKDVIPHLMQELSRFKQ